MTRLSFKIERKDYHLACYPVNRLRELEIIDIEQILAFLRKHIERTECKFELGDKFEKRKIEIATHTNLYHKVELLEQKLLLLLHGKINHRADTCCNIRTVVIATLCRKLDV